MKSTTCDILIVGGGPAGSAAAYSAANLGLSVVLIDKARFPREKLCGGLVTLRSKKIFEQVFQRTWNGDLLLSSSSIGFFSEDQKLAEQVGYSTLYFTMRRDFDAYLLSLAKSTTAEIREDASIAKIDAANNLVVLDNNETINFRCLIAADGVNSQIAKEFFGQSFNTSTIGFGLEVEVSRKHLPNQSDQVEIDFGAATWGYGWIFPKKATFTIGVGGIHHLNDDLREKLEKYLSWKGLKISDYKVKGQYIPFGDFRRTPGLKNILLCGDAAGVVDPITGEGIAHAMQSGSLAANAAFKAISTGNPEGAIDYYKYEYAEIAKSIRQANFWRYLIFPKIIRKPFTWAFSDAGTLQRGYLDILAGKHEYNALYRLFALQIWRAFLKPFAWLLRSRR